MPVNVAPRSQAARFAEEAFSLIWGDDWLNQWASRTQYSADYLDQWLSDANMHHSKQRVLDDMVQIHLELKLRWLQMAIAFNEHETETILNSSDKNAACLMRMYGEGVSMRRLRHGIERLLQSLRSRVTAYDAWLSRARDPDERG
jgi:hypothetical protein